MTVLIVGLNFSGIAQQVTNVSGGDVKSSTGSVSYSVGQVFQEYQQSTAGSVTQGVQQTYTISTLYVKNISMNLLIDVYPNPTADLLVLKVMGLKENSLKYRLLDLNGALIVSESILGESTQLDLHSLPSSTYFIEVLRDTDKLQTFKIIKTH
jgi:hypothetical protein